MVPIIEKAKGNQSYLKQAYRAGVTCRKKARWIGLIALVSCSTMQEFTLIIHIIFSVPENSIQEFHKRHMCETAEQVALGIERGAFREGEYVLLSKKGLYRIGAPSAGDHTMRSCILWEKKSTDDTTPVDEKIVSVVTLVILVLHRVLYSLERRYTISNTSLPSLALMTQSVLSKLKLQLIL